VDAALSGVLENTGEPDRPPVGEAPGSCYFVGAVAGALGSIIAHYHRQTTGQGQHVDVSIQEAAAMKNGMTHLIWEFDQRLITRSAPRGQYGRTPTIGTYACQDGFVRFSLPGGRSGIPQTRALSAWMDADGVANPLREVADSVIDMVSIEPATLDRYESAIARFLLAHPRQELAVEGARRGIRIAAVADIPEVLASDHLRARAFWSRIPDPGLGVQLAYPRHFFLSDETVNYADRPAPALGQHTAAILAEEAVAPSAPSVTARPAPDQALAGVRVLDFGWELVGPYTGRNLAVYGAQVIRVESALRPDGVRTNRHIARSQPGPADDKPWFTYVNNSKLSLQLDLKHPRAADLIDRLVGWADVVNANFRPGTMARLGFDYARLRQINPGLVMLESSIYGQTGPLAGESGWDATGSAAAGRLSLQGWPDRAPVTPTCAAYGDEVQPMINALAIVAALDYRRRTGRGQYLDSSMVEVLAHQVAPAMLDWQANARPQHRAGNRVRNAAPHGVFPCQGDDRWCAIAVFTEAEWGAFGTALGNPDWVREARFATRELRQQHEDELEAHVAAWTRQQSAEAVMELLQAAGVAAGVVQDAQDVMDRDPQLRARPAHVAIEHPVLGVFGHPTPPYKLSGTPAQIRTSPRLGEHNSFICTELLDMSAAEFEELAQSGLFR
jgi:benzylsuccinate CoA-transferase BbsF subunit